MEDEKVLELLERFLVAFEQLALAVKRAADVYEDLNPRIEVSGKQ